MKFILRLFPEISIKSRPVRNRLIRLLQQNIINVSKHHGFSTKIIAQWDKLIVDIDKENADEETIRALSVKELSRIPGIHSFMEVMQFEYQSFEDIFEKARALYEKDLCNKTFCVRVKRRGNHEFTSQMAERQIGGMFKQQTQNNGVCLDNPDVKINIEIDGNKCFLVANIYKGIGGYPVSSQGEALTLISGGFDSGVSTYLAIKRGLKVHYIFFNMGGLAHEIGVKQESYFIWDRFASSHRVKFITIPFEKIVGEILEKTHHGVRGVILKRMMVRVASKVAERLDCKAIITGESLGQVSSQTIDNLSHIDAVSESLILRPLTMSDKQDIIDVAESIGTGDFARSMPEYCGVISDHPNVCPKRSFVEEQEALMQDGLIEDALERSKALDIKDIPFDTTKLKQDVQFVSEVTRNDVVIDVRASDDEQKSPLKLENVEILKIPFYKVAAEFSKLDNLKTYLLYCDQGVMSIAQASYLKSQGYHNVKVLRF